MVNGEQKHVDLRKLKKQLYLCLVAVNVLEAIRFYVSFACSFAFAERKLMEGNAKIIKLIARDEALHLTSTQHMINILASGKDDPEMAEIAEDCREESIEIFRKAAEQEKEWAGYLFKDGSMIGLNKDILCQYIEYITNLRMEAVGLPVAFPNSKSGQHEEDMKELAEVMGVEGGNWDRERSHIAKAMELMRDSGANEREYVVYATLSAALG